MNNIKQSLAVQRQIPEHIRENYPLFVEFIKGYYDYLYSQQIFDLENSHDIDQVCEAASSDSLYDSFVNKFKFELARNFPIHMAEDRAILLKHLRDFYLSRGSEDSFKFLFRTLFNKEATISYPSEQMLRVSDGKWKVDTSIFINPDVTGPNPVDMEGMFIQIFLQGKVLDTYIERAQVYSENVYELFITHKDTSEIVAGNRIEFINNLADVNITGGSCTGFTATIAYSVLDHEIVVGDVVTIEGVVPEQYNGTYRVSTSEQGSFSFEHTSYHTSTITTLGKIRINKYPSNILACPSKVSVYRGGSGFTVGDIFSLKTSKGNGCVIKVTKIANEGTTKGIIKNIQVIKFGLDYVSTFYSYLSNSTIIAPEYIHPVSFSPYTPGDPTYTENSDGFIDSGWASRQDYFYYHANLAASSPADKYFADTSYTGDILQEFYTDNSYAQDDSLAIIKVELGAVAKYPGYYLNNDGFISDIMFIQDGFYYQAFSYVIKVEKELQRYLDILKILVHPVGMQVFSEYNIYNEMLLENVIPESSTTLVLPLFEQTPSRVTILDAGIGYTNYVLTTNGSGIVTGMVPDYNSGQVYSDSSPVKAIMKRAWSEYSLDDASQILVDKYILGDTVSAQTTYFNIFPTKLLEDTTTFDVDILAIQYDKVLSDSITFDDLVIFNKGISPSDDINITDSGRLRYAPYDTTDDFSYFAVTDDYQSATPIT